MQFAVTGQWSLNMNFLLTYYFKSWCCPFKASRWFSCSILILGLGLLLWLIRDRWWFCLCLSGLSHANAPTESEKHHLPCADVGVGWDGRSISSFLVLAKQNGSGRELGPLPLETTQPLKGAENILRLYSVLPRQQPEKLSDCKESSCLWRTGTFIPAGERLSWHVTQQGWLPPYWGKHDQLLLHPVVLSLRWLQATGRRHSLATGRHPAAETCPELRVWGRRVWNLSSEIDPDTREIDLCVQREKEPPEKDEDLTCFSDKHLLTKGCLYRLCVEATKPLQLNRLEERDSREILSKKLSHYYSRCIRAQMTNS